MDPITHMLTDLARLRLQYITDTLSPYEMKAFHALNLVQICRTPGLSQDVLARRRMADKSSIARQAAAMEESGLITRVPCADDKRVMKLYPTQKALELLPTIEQMLLSWENQLTQDLEEPEKAQLVELLLRMKQRALEMKEAE